MTNSLGRRSFLKTTAATGALLSAPIIQGKAQTKKFRTATIGCGWWGLNITKNAIASGETEIVGLCDVDQSPSRDLDTVHREDVPGYDASRPYLEKAQQMVEALCGDKPRLYTDYREMLEKEKPEIVIVGTPDHWHALPTIDAVKAGAHVYVEKPVCHTVLEGKAMVDAARKYNRVVQVGTHRRLAVHNTSAMKFLWEGHAGKIGSIKAFVVSGYGGDHRTEDSDPPQGLDWDLWCGPGPLVPFNSRMHPKGFRQFMDFGNGQLGDWGIHWMDQILWWAKDEITPHTIFSSGGRFTRTEDNTNSPDTQNANFAFDNLSVTWEHRFYAGNPQEKTSIGCYFYGTKGVLHLGWLDGWTFYPSGRGEKEVHEDCVFHNKDKENIKEVFADLLDAIKTNRRPACDIEYGYRASCMSLIANISLKIGRSVAWDQKNSQILNDPEASKLLRRDYRAPWVFPEV
ncbi:MAG: Gfo/Idh/MocA family oxidoreductase [bacterium]|nr:Gfo/Idh/MocA family oxidoreductase [bacterium]